MKALKRPATTVACACAAVGAAGLWLAGGAAHAVIVMPPQAPASAPATGAPAAPTTERSIQMLPGSAAPTTLQNAIQRPGEATGGLTARAMAGDAQAMLELGQHYRLSGQPQSRAQALQWFKRAAEAGEARAMAGYGYLISGAAGGARNLNEARQWLQRAQAMNLVRATYLLALVEKSASGPKQKARAKTLLQQAVREGDAYAMNDLGVELELEGDTAGATRLYTRAAQAGVERARQNLERLQSNRKAQDTEQLQRLRTLASDGDADALLQMAQRYHLGQGVQVDYARALSYYRQAADAGSGKAREFLALIFSRGDSTQPNQPDAAWMQQLAGRIQAAALWSESRSGGKALDRPARIEDPLADLTSPAGGTRPSVLP